MIKDLDKQGYQGTYWLQNIVTSGEKTIGNIAAPKGVTDITLLPTPKNFELGFRNFPRRRIFHIHQGGDLVIVLANLFLDKD